MDKTVGWNGYLDWALECGVLYASESRTGSPQRRGPGSDADLKAARDAALWEPIFVRSKIDGSEAFFTALDFLAQLGLRYDPFEKTYNEALGLIPVEAILYRRLDAPDFNNDLFEVLSKGAPVETRSLPQSVAIDQTHPGDEPVVIGVIDDTIGVLHGQFRDTATSTRIHSLLTHNALGLASEPHASAVKETSKADLDGALQQQRDEGAYYRDVARDTFNPNTRHGFGHPNSHGTHILDLAAGARLENTDPLSQVPVLACQLSPQAFDDTSGAKLTFEILRSLRWLIFQTHALCRNAASPKLIVNMSLGYVAGPKDGTSFLEQAIAREITHASDALGLDVQLVVPFGNAYGDNVIARRRLRRNQSQQFDLRLARDDKTPSFIELRLTDIGANRNPETLALKLNHSRHSFMSDFVFLPAGYHHDLRDGAGNLVARLYHTPARMIFGVEEPAYLTIAFAPTTPTVTHDLISPAGLWTIEVQHKGLGLMDLVVQAQRDDDPSARPIGARQVRFEDEFTRAWDPANREYSGLEDVIEFPGRRTRPVVTNEGTNSALSTIDHPNVTAVGAALVRRDLVGNVVVEPARDYGAQGADWSGQAPTNSAISETGYGLNGVLAAGLRSGENTRLSGSSTSCATVARQLVLEALGEAPLPTQNTTAAQDRLGVLTVLDNPAIRRP